MAALLASWLAAAGADFAILNLRVVEGEGMVYAPGARATRGLTIEVTDETGHPVPGVAVSFQLPDDGPSGTFVSGGRSEVVTTAGDGRANVWGMRWNKVPGTVSVRITAAKEGVRAGLVTTQVLDASANVQPVKVSRGGHSKMLLIGLAVAGAAGAGLALGLMHGSNTSSTTAANPAPTVGTPTVTIGPPQ
jgi:hypothetical protein